jgi:hypothetical protein
MFGKDDIVFSYTRSDAIADGVLVDVTDYTPEGEHVTLVRQAGFKIPVALTRAVYDSCVALPEEYEGLDDITGRLWDILFCMRMAAERNKQAAGVRFKVSVRDIDGKHDSGTQRVHELVSVIGPGDDASPVITIMFPNED